MFAKAKKCQMWGLGLFLFCISTALFATSGHLAIQPEASTWHDQFLIFLTNPNVAYLLLLSGMYGLFFEAVNPGLALPGVIGGICLLLALYAFQLLPVNYVGLGLILLGIGFLVAEAFLPSGVMAAGGITAFVFGSIMLFDKGTPGFGVALSLILGIAVTTAAFFIIVMRLALKAHSRPIVTGSEQLLNSRGKIVNVEPHTAWMRVGGEMWQVKSDAPLKKGQKVIITGREGLVLLVKIDPKGKTP